MSTFKVKNVNGVIKERGTQVPDLWHIAMTVLDGGSLEGLPEEARNHLSEGILECWHMAHDLKDIAMGYGQAQIIREAKEEPEATDESLANAIDQFGSANPDQAWLYVNDVTWLPNPHYVGPVAPRPETQDTDQKEAEPTKLTRDDLAELVDAIEFAINECCFYLKNGNPDLDYEGDIEGLEEVNHRPEAWGSLLDKVYKMMNELDRLEAGSNG